MQLIYPYFFLNILVILSLDIETTLNDNFSVF